MPEAAGHAVGVAGGHGGDASRRAHLRAQAVRDACARGQRLHERDARAQRERRTQREVERRSPPAPAAGRSRRCRSARGRSARRRRADPAEFAACASGGRRPAASSSSSTTSKRASCSVGVGVVGFVGDGKVRAHARERELVARGDRARERERVVGRTADAVHAGVDLEVHVERARPPGVGDGLGQRVDAGLGVDDRVRAAAATTRAATRGAGSDSSMTGASMPAPRSCSPSSTRATPSQEAPASSAARATGTAPWP